jgi:hypothetical protein
MGFTRTEVLWVIPICVIALGIVVFAVGKAALNAFRPTRATVTFKGLNDHRPAPPTNLRISVDGVEQPQSFQMSVSVPETIRIDQTGEIKVGLLNPTAVTTKTGLSIPSVDSPAFDIKGPNTLSTNPNVLEWQWLVTPKRTGKSQD